MIKCPSGMNVTEEECEVCSQCRPRPKPCSDYDEETGNCKGSGKSCDTCYENSLKIFW